MPIVGTSENTAFGSNAGSNTVPVTVPSGTRRGDVLVWWGTSDWTSAGGTRIPTGFRVVPPFRLTSYADRQEISVGVRVVGDGEPASHEAIGNAAIYGLVALRGVSLVGMRNAVRMYGRSSSESQSPWSYVAPAYRVPQASEVLWLAFGDPKATISAGLTSSVPSGYTKLYERATSGGWFHILLATRAVQAGLIPPAIGRVSNGSLAAGCVVHSLAFPRVAMQPTPHPHAGQMLAPFRTLRPSADISNSGWSGTPPFTNMRYADTLRVSTSTSGAALGVELG